MVSILVSVLALVYILTAVKTQTLLNTLQLKHNNVTVFIEYIKAVKHTSLSMSRSRHHVFMMDFSS